MDSLKGQLLVASPALFDPNFRRTVILVGEHGDEGAMGVVLTRPSETSVAEAADMMMQRGIGCLPVVEREKLVGIVTKTDLLRCLRTLSTEATGPWRFQI